ncbi:MAG: YCF48-related protein, partial [Candidatus Electryonea clarkiae]|nr:YCF48-related protein [Candidatus Electryonea clarkiae]
GTILHTEDAGETWESQRHNAGRWSFETSIAFVDDSTGWGLCTNGLIKTTNGGRTWEYQESLRISVYDIAIINADTIIVTSSSGRIFRTINAGESWAPLEGLSTALSIHFQNQDGWAVGNSGKMFKIFNSGEIWNQQSRDYRGRIFSSCFIDSLTGWMVGEFNHVYKTDDGGNTWNIQEVPVNLFPRIYDVFFIDESYGWAAGNIIIATVDGGENWFEQDVDSVGLRRGFGDVCFVNRDTGWITGSISGVLVTSNGGDDWEVQDIQDIENVRLIHPIFFLNDNEGWLSNGRDMIKTTDGGESWEVFDQVVDIWEISDIFFINSDTGYAVGGDEVFAVAPMFGTGIIWRTEDGGENWEILDVRAGHQFNSITFADSLIGWAVGYSGVSYFTIDGGNHWQNYEITSEYSYSDVDFINSTTGWITGVHEYFNNDHSCVLKTMNGGYVLTIPEEKELFLPNNISILSSYPNPFNPSTTIRLGLPYTTSINVAIYNIIGQKVAQLATGRYSAGYHSIIFNASELSSGIYFIHASVPGKMNEVRKIVLMK